jgi:GT2 family glycosyltransferase
VDAKKDIDALQRKAVDAHLIRRGLPWRTETIAPHRLRLKPSAARLTPRVSIIIPTRDQGELLNACLKSIFAQTSHRDFEVVVVDNQTSEAAALEAMSAYPIRRILFDQAFNYSAANNLGVSAASGELLLFLNNDTEVLEPDWLQDMALYFADPGIGAVGTILLYPNRSVQHAGVVLGARGTADHAMRGFPENVDGYNGSLQCAREVSAVSAACMMMRRETFDQVGGFSCDYNRHYQDVDLCLKIRSAGLRIISASHPRLLHHESASRDWRTYDFADRAVLIDRWHEIIQAGDPYYNARFDKEALNYALHP